VLVLAKDEIKIWWRNHREQVYDCLFLCNRCRERSQKELFYWITGRIWGNSRGSREPV